MMVIRNAEEMARALNSTLHPELKQLLHAHWEHLSEYEDYSLEELALFIITEPHDTLDDIEAACPRRLIQVGGGAATFAIPPEVIEQHSSWVEGTFIFSDDGYGLVLLLQLGDGTDPLLMSACMNALRHLDSNAAE